MYSPWHDWDSTLMTNRVMDSGIHRISLIYTVPTKETISTMMGFEVEQLGTNFLPKPPRNFVSAAVDRYSMALFGVVPDCLTLAPIFPAAARSQDLDHAAAISQVFLTSPREVCPLVADQRTKRVEVILISPLTMYLYLI